MTSKSHAKPRKLPRQTRSLAMFEAIVEASARVLLERGYEGMSTNAVAERAGVSVGSLYQYFPNKTSLLAALHARHAAQMSQSLSAILDDPGKVGLRDDIARLVRAAMAAHELDPELHRLLERERPFFEDRGEAQSGADIHQHIYRLLHAHRDAIAQPDLGVAAWMTANMTESLVHAAVLHAPKPDISSQVEAAIVDAIVAFLTFGASAHTSCQMQQLGLSPDDYGVGETEGTPSRSSKRNA